MKLGLISDTHGYLHPRIHDLFKGVDEILHAGDVDTDDVLIELRSIAPVTAVRGNMDTHSRVEVQRDLLIHNCDGMRILLVHDLTLPHHLRRPVSSAIQQHAPQIVVFGHTHVPYWASHQNILYINPGSASKGRQGALPSVALLNIVNGQTTGQHLPLDI